MNDLMTQTEALLGFSADLERRLTDRGLGGVTGVVERFEELLSGLDEVSNEQLEWARREIGDLVATLTGVAEHLDMLYAIKQAVPRSRFAHVGNGAGVAAAA
jgi:hypothetical protein